MTVSKIEKIEALKFRMPLGIKLKSGKKVEVREVDHVLVRITTDDGITGIGEAMASPTYSESSASIVWAIEQWIAPKLKAVPLFAMERIWDQIETINGSTAKGAVDIAIHDAQAKSLGVPLYRLLGGWTDKIPLTWIVGQGTADEMVQDSLTAQKKGFKSFKIKVGIDYQKDIKNIELLRKMLGDEALIYVDANQAYSFPEARKVIPIMENSGIAMVEDPIPSWQAENRLKLSRIISIPMIGDLCVPSPVEVAREIDLGAISVINVKTPRTGYFLSQKVIHLAESAGYPCIMGTLLETDIGVLASAHFAAAFRIFTYPAELTYFLKMESSLLKNKIKIENGLLYLPNEPGLGAELDEERIRYYSQERF